MVHIAKLERPPCAIYGAHREIREHRVPYMVHMAKLERPPCTIYGARRGLSVDATGRKRAVTVKLAQEGDV